MYSNRNIFIFWIHRTFYVWYLIFADWNLYLWIAWNILGMVCKPCLCLYYALLLRTSSHWKSWVCVHNCFRYHWTLSCHRASFTTFQGQKIPSIHAYYHSSYIQYSKILWIRNEGKKLNYDFSFFMFNINIARDFWIKIQNDFFSEKARCWGR